jgi:predicted deacylase
MIYRYALSLVVFLLLGACATPIVSYDSGEPCKATAFTVLDGFTAARRGSCRVLSENHVELSIRPEDDGYINPSPWFAFKISAPEDTTAIVSLQYVGGRHRYIPKISTDGLNWRPVDANGIKVSRKGTRATFDVQLEEKVTWVAAQELVTPVIYNAWNSRTAAQSDAELLLLGQSVAKQPIHYLVSNPGAKDVLLLVGRQHPPEVSGSFAMFSFVETLFADTELAMRFRERFQIIAIPLLNPDGVVGGNWRHNLGSTDLNRDWGIFEQPETLLVGNLLDRLDAAGNRIRVFLDFHSTDRNVFYTQDASVPTEPPEFFETWFAQAAPRLTDYEFTNDAGPGKRASVAKNYMYQRYGIPAATYEVGDETDRTVARRAAVVFAEELMILMLEKFAQAR